MPFFCISKKKIAWVRQLLHKRGRSKYGAFVVQGSKSVQELLESSSYITQLIAASAAWWEQQQPPLTSSPHLTSLQATPAQLAAMGSFKTNYDVVAVATIQSHPLPYWQAGTRLLILDRLQDPSNVGTILRIADWYGIRHVVCAQGTVDYLHPVALQASMGSFLRVKVSYTDLASYLTTFSGPCLGTFLTGTNIHTSPMPTEGALILGNEAQGIDETLLGYITHRLTIPAYGKAESLNVATAAGILCDRWVAA